MTSYHDDLKRAMEGQKILRLEVLQQKGEPHPELIIHLSNGAAITVMSDEEGNDNGALHLLTPPSTTALPAGLLFTPDMIGQKYTSRGRTFTITGYKASRPKYPVQVERDDGSKFKAGLAHVLMLLRAGAHA
jgi:uncharacterized protein YaiI (UPF0178 family)